MRLCEAAFSGARRGGEWEGRDCTIGNYRGIFRAVGRGNVSLTILLSPTSVGCMDKFRIPF